MNETLAPRLLFILFVCSFFLSTEGVAENVPGWVQAGSVGQQSMPSARFMPPELAYSSVFTNYQGYREEEIISWRDANETVRRIGGWRSYLEEAARPEQPALSPPEAAGRHTGHGGGP